MKKETEKRLRALEDHDIDWISRLEYIDYGISGEDYSDESVWEEIYIEESITVVRNQQTGEVRGHYLERRGNEEIAEAGGDLSYL